MSANTEEVEHYESLELAEKNTDAQKTPRNDAQTTATFFLHTKRHKRCIIIGVVIAVLLSLVVGVAVWAVTGNRNNRDVTLQHMQQKLQIQEQQLLYHELMIKNLSEKMKYERDDFSIRTDVNSDQLKNITEELQNQRDIFTNGTETLNDNIILQLSHTIGGADCSDVRRLYPNVPTGRYPIRALFFSFVYSDAYVYSPRQALCDMDTDGGPWLVIQQRSYYPEAKQVGFTESWTAYSNGFGNEVEFWIGNRFLHQLTSQGRTYKLRVELGDWENNTRYAEYSSFRVESESQNFILRLGAYSGNAGDSLSPHNNRPFTTYDRDNDGWGGGNCAQREKGGWWYEDCQRANLNGLHYQGGNYSSRWADGMAWLYWRGHMYALQTVSMKLAAVN